MLSFQEIILRLQSFWAKQGCAILQPYDMEVGAGTSSPMTVLRALGKQPWSAAFVQPCRRPTDGRYGENPNRTQYYYQFQVILKPNPKDSQLLYLQSLEAMGLNLAVHDIRFVEDDWENPSLGAAGLGWEVWCDGMEISQFTYFQQVGGIMCDPVSVELTYGLERIASKIQNVDNSFEINWNGKEGADKITYRDVSLVAEQQFSAYNFEHANTDILFQDFLNNETQCQNLLAHNLVLPAYEQCLKANHTFNLLDARGVISVAERANYILKIRTLVKQCCELWLEDSANA